MNRALKSFLVMNFMLSIGVLAMAVVVFQDRELIKGRALLLEQGLDQIAQNLDWGEAVAWEQAEERRLSPYSVLQPGSAEELSQLEENIDSLSRFATTRVAQLNQRYGELVHTQQTLSDTEDTLAARERDLDHTRQTLSSTENMLANTQQDLRESQRNNDELAQKNKGLEGTIASLEKDNSELNNQIGNLEVDLEERDGVIARLEDMLYGDRGPASELEGDSGLVLAVDSEWNYIVIDKGSVDNLPLYMEALLHREGSFLGKARIVKVDDTVAVAELMNDTLAEGTTIQVGDRFFF